MTIDLTLQISFFDRSKKEVTCETVKLQDVYFVIPTRPGYYCLLDGRNPNANAMVMLRNFRGEPWRRWASIPASDLRNMQNMIREFQEAQRLPVTQLICG
jgi:hypothetical protein